MSDVTQILCAIESGDPSAAERLLPLVYDELRRLASHRLAQEEPGQTLQPTALVHEAYLRLVDGAAAVHWNGRGHFFGAAAEAMRRILVEQARRKASLKRGGDWCRMDLDDAVDGRVAQDGFDVLDLNEALTRFEQLEPRMAELVKLRFFAGLDLAESAAALGVSTATAKRDWTYARAWLYGEIAGR